MSCVDKYKQALNLFYSNIKPKRILYIGKVCGIRWTDNYFSDYIYQDDVMLTSIILKDDHMANEEKQLSCFLKKTKGDNIYCTLSEFCENIRLYQDFDFVLVDTIHSFSLLDLILKIFSKNSQVKYMSFHDAFPVKHYLNENTLLVTKKNHNDIWCGRTPFVLYNYYLNNPTTTYLIDDDFVGYAFVKCNGKNNVVYTSVDNYKDSDLQNIAPIVMKHEPFIKYTFNSFIEDE